MNVSDNHITTAAAALALLHSMNSNTPVENNMFAGAKMIPKAAKESKANPICATPSPTPPQTPAPKLNRRDFRKGKRGKKMQATFPVEPRIIQVVGKPRTYTDHSYRDFSSVPPEPNYEAPVDISQMSFPEKVHHMLSRPEFSRYCSWRPHGRAFSITVPKMFETKVCPEYLGHSRYSSFLRQLSNHSFKHISQGKDRNCYYHEFMLRGLPHLCKYMPEPKDARRLIPDPENEPDLYAISEAYPLPDSAEAKPGAAVKQNKTEDTQRTGSTRPISCLALETGLAPSPKRRRTTPVSGTAAVPQTSHLASQATSPEQLMAQLLKSSGSTNVASVLLAARNAGSAATPATSVVTVPTKKLAAGNFSAQPSATGWCALQSPQMQAATDKNAAILAAIQAGLETQQVPRAPPASPSAAMSIPVTSLPPHRNTDTTNQATSLAAAILGQTASKNVASTNNVSSVLSALATLLYANQTR